MTADGGRRRWCRYCCKGTTEMREYYLAAPIFGQEEIIFTCDDKARECERKALEAGYNFRRWVSFDYVEAALTHAGDKP